MRSVPLCQWPDVFEFVGPSAFEHLMVHVLQLESGNAISWHHVGGSGDGGVDGIGMSAKGEVAGVLQCKWYYSGNLHDLVRDGQRVRERWPNAKVGAVAVLLGPEKKTDCMEEGVEILLLEMLQPWYGNIASDCRLRKASESQNSDV